MKILITGSHGFIGKNLVSVLQYQGHVELFLANRQTDHSKLIQMLNQVDIIIHLAGASRSRSPQNSFQENLDYTRVLVDHAKKEARFIFLSTNKKTNIAYWETKLKEEALIATRKHFDILRLDNVFGKWAKPFYNSVVATFIEGLILNKPFQLFQENEPIDFIYIDDLIKDLMFLLERPASNLITTWVGKYRTTAQKLLVQLKSIHDDYMQGHFLQYADPFKEKLTLTYLSYLPEKNLIMPLLSHVDNRGHFIEIMKGPHQGQWSLNSTNPGALKGNHFHHIRWEKFIVIKGHGSIKLRKKFDHHVMTFSTQDIQYKALTIPPGFVHHLVNEGQEEMVVWMWSSIVYDASNPDTYIELV